MNLILQTEDLNEYLKETSVIDFHHPAVQAKIEEIKRAASTDEARAKLAFEYARDEIKHSFDSPERTKVTISASEAMGCHEGICFAKAHVLAALLRGLGIPCGFCYQRVTRKGTPESGHALHGLNAVYLADRKKWFRVDPRGNKPGVNSQFTIDHEQLAYPIRTELGEVDYPYVFAEPLEEVLASMRNSRTSGDLFYNRPPELVTS